MGQAHYHFVSDPENPVYSETPESTSDVHGEAWVTPQLASGSSAMVLVTFGLSTTTPGSLE